MYWALCQTLSLHCVLQADHEQWSESRDIAHFKDRKSEFREVGCVRKVTERR